MSITEFLKGLPGLAEGLFVFQVGSRSPSESGVSLVLSQKVKRISASPMAGKDGSASVNITWEWVQFSSSFSQVESGGSSQRFVYHSTVNGSGSQGTHWTSLCGFWLLNARTENCVLRLTVFVDRTPRGLSLVNKLGWHVCIALVSEEMLCDRESFFWLSRTPRSSCSSPRFLFVLFISVMA